MDYESGVVLSLIWSLGALLFNIGIRSGTYGENLARVGFRISLITGNLKETGNTFVEFLVLLVVSVITALFSWLGLFVGVVFTLYGLWKNAGAPPSVKEVRWKLRNVPMKADDVRALLMSMQTVASVPSVS